MNDKMFAIVGGRLDQDWKAASTMFEPGPALQVCADLLAMNHPSQQQEFLRLITESPSHLHFAQQFCVMGMKEAEYRRQVAMRDAESDDVA